MRTGFLPRVAVAALVLVVAVVFLSGQLGQAAANPHSPQGCTYGYNYTYYVYYSYYPYYSHYRPPAYHGYAYPYYYCYDTYYGYYYNYYSYPYTYTYDPPASKYELTVATDPADLGTASGSGTYNQGSSAAFSITRDTVQVAPNERYVFSHWGGDYSGVGASGTITMNSARKIVAVYQLQYHLDVSVQPQSAPLPQGEGWYNAGDAATLTVASEMLGGGDGSRLVFQGWNVDGSLKSGTTLSLKMDSPHAVSAQYKQQYYLKVVTDQGVAYGEGWYDEGTTAEIYASTPVSTSYGVSVIFNGWQGDSQSTSQSASVVMDKPKSVIASWRTDATILNLTMALGIIAAFVAGAGIIAYVALSRSRPREQPLKPIPKQQGPTVVSETPTPVKRKSVPLKKKTVPEKADVAESAT